MCVESKICCAPTSDGRCPNNTVHSNSDHCLQHHDQAVESYFNYKRICKIADSKDVYIEIKDIRQHLKYLYECHKVLQEAYCARFEHAEKFYVIKTQDYGHDKVFQLILTKIDYCRTKSKELKEKLKAEAQTIPVKAKQQSPVKCMPNQRWNLLELFFPSDEPVIQENDKQEEEENFMLEEIAQFEKKQADDDKEFNLRLKADRKKNKKLAAEKRKLVIQSISLIKQELTPEFDNYFLQLSFINLLSQLNEMNYFDEYYEPEECSKCSCGQYVPVQFKLGCGCFLDKDGDCIDFLCKSPISKRNLLDLCDIIQIERFKIKPILTELINYYKTHGTKLLNRPLTLTWDPELNRLVLSCEYIKNYQKPSVNMAESRKRRQLGKDKVIRRKRDISPDTKWGCILDQLCDYISKNDKLPPNNSKNVFTSFLHNWLYEQLDDYANENNFLYSVENRKHFEKFINRYPKFFKFLDE